MRQKDNGTSHTSYLTLSIEKRSKHTQRFTSNYFQISTCESRAVKTKISLSKYMDVINNDYTYKG